MPFIPGTKFLEVISSMIWHTEINCSQMTLQLKSCIQTCQYALLGKETINVNHHMQCAKQIDQNSKNIITYS